MNGLPDLYLIFSEFWHVTLLPLFLAFLAGRFASAKVSIIFLSLVLLGLAGIAAYLVQAPPRPFGADAFMIASMLGFFAFPIFVSVTYGLLAGQWVRRRKGRAT